MNNTTCAALGFPLTDTTFIFHEESFVIIGSFVLIALSAFIVFSNAIIIAALAWAGFKQYRRPGLSDSTSNITRILMASMAVSDIILGGLIMPLVIYENISNGHWFTSWDLCSARNLGDIILSTVSIYHVVCMALERYLAVCKPFVHLTLSVKKCLFMVFINWAFPIFLFVLVYMNGWEQVGIESLALCFRMRHQCILAINLSMQIPLATLSFYIPFASMFTLYYFILREIWSLRRRIPRCSGLHKHSARSFQSTWQMEESRSTEAIGFVELTASIKSTAYDEQKLPYSTLLTMSAMGNGKTVTNEGHSSTEPSIALTVELDTKEASSELPGQTFISTNRPVQGTTARTATLDMASPMQPLVESPSALPRVQTKTNPKSATQFSPTEYNLLGPIRAKITREKTPGLPPLPQTPSTSPGTLRSRKNERPCNAHNSSATINYSPLAHKKHMKRKQQKNVTSKRRSLKAVRTIGGIVIAFTVCWLPFSVYVVVASFYKFSLPYWPITLLAWLGYTNSALNPILYCSNRSVRSDVKALIGWSHDSP